MWERKRMRSLCYKEKHEEKGRGIHHSSHNLGPLFGGRLMSCDQLQDILGANHTWALYVYVLRSPRPKESNGTGFDPGARGEQKYWHPPRSAAQWVGF